MRGWLLAPLALAAAVLVAGAAPRPAESPRATRTYRIPFYASSDFAPQWTPPAHRMGAFALTDQHGRRLTQEDLNGRITVVHFFFASCGSTCPTLMGNLKALPKAFPRGQVQILSLSVDPASDTPQRLEAYAHKLGLGGSWHLLTGDRQVIYRLAQDSLFCRQDLVRPHGGREFLHTEKVFLVDGSGHLRGLYNGSLRLEVERLADEIRCLQAEERS